MLVHPEERDVYVSGVLPLKCCIRSRTLSGEFFQWLAHLECYSLFCEDLDGAHCRRSKVESFCWFKVHTRSYVESFSTGALDEKAVRRIGFGSAARTPVLVERTKAEVAGTQSIAKFFSLILQCECHFCESFFVPDSLCRNPSDCENCSKNWSGMQPWWRDASCISWLWLWFLHLEWSCSYSTGNHGLSSSFADTWIALALVCSQNSNARAVTLEYAKNDYRSQS